MPRALEVERRLAVADAQAKSAPESPNQRRCPRKRADASIHARWAANPADSSRGTAATVALTAAISYPAGPEFDGGQRGPAAPPAGAAGGTRILRAGGSPARGSVPMTPEADPFLPSAGWLFATRGWRRVYGIMNSVGLPPRTGSRGSPSLPLSRIDQEPRPHRDVAYPPIRSHRTGRPRRIRRREPAFPGPGAGFRALRFPGHHVAA